MRARTRMQLRAMGVIVPLACVLTPLFNLATDEVSLGAVVQGVVDAFLVSTALGAYLLFVRDGMLRSWFRRRAFLANLLLNGSAILALFFVMRGLGQAITSGHPHRLYSSMGDAHLRYAIPFVAVLAFGLQFLMQVNRMIGANVVRYFVTGVYQRPREEERIFLFLDLESSTRLAERLGGATYYELLRRFVDDLSEPILESRGEIYQYAGDEVIVTWRSAVGLRDASCVRCFFRIEETIARGAAAYERDFGAVPRFRAGLHGGPVIAGELGDLRQEIVFTGDTVNTTARLEEYARRHDRRLVVSGDLLERLVLPAEFRAERLEEFRARGKERAVVVYALTQAGGAAGAGH